MQLGLAIGIFIIVAIILISLFCIVTRYFNYRLRKAMQQQAQLYSLIQGIQGERQDINEGEYEDFVHKRIQQIKKKKSEKQSKSGLDQKFPIDIQMTNMNQPLKIYEQDIYGLPKLKRKQFPPSIPINSQTNRSLISSKTFKAPDPFNLQSKRSNVSRNSNQNDPMNKNKPNIIVHKYISKLVSYTEQNMTIVQISVKELWKQAKSGPINQKKSARIITINPTQNGFDDALQAYGFEKDMYGAYKFVTSAEIVNMKQKQIYETVFLKKTQEKLEMQFPSFYLMKDNIQSIIENKQKQKNKPKQSNLEAMQLIKQIINQKQKQKQKERQKQKRKQRQRQRQKQLEIERQLQKEKEKQRQAQQMLRKEQEQKKSQKQKQQELKKKKQRQKQNELTKKKIAKFYQNKGILDDDQQFQLQVQKNQMGDNSHRGFVQNFISLLDKQ